MRQRNNYVLGHIKITNLQVRLTYRNSKTITIVTKVANFICRDQTCNMSANAVTANRKIYCASSPLLLSPSKVFVLLEMA